MSDITIHLTSSLTASERKVSSNWTIEIFQSKLEFITGIPPKDQKIWVYPSNESNEKSELSPSDKTATLTQAGVTPYCRIHVENTNSDPESEVNLLEKTIHEDISNGANSADYEGKFELTEEKYSEMNNTVLNYMKENKVGKFDPELKTKTTASLLSQIEVGSRCRVITGDRRGYVRYVGPIPEINASGDVWVGVELDLATGKNDGSIKGTRYFQCETNHGAFVKPQSVEMGNFAVIGQSDEEDDDEEL